jgi:hypothetical protein
MLWNFINKVKKSFTLLEVLIICGAFSIVIVSIIWAINRSYAFMSSTRMKVRAVNFAREWVEMMFNMRDTNWREHSWEKDVYWLWTWSTKLKEGIYVLKERDNGSGDMYIYASGLIVAPWEIDDFYSNFRKSKVKEQARLSFTWAYDYLTWKYDGWIWKFEQTTWNLQDLLWNDGEFYRIVRVYDIVNKIEDCIDVSCPKEMHFCVKIFYRHQWEHETELCSIMTNFEE